MWNISDMFLVNFSRWNKYGPPEILAAGRWKLHVMRGICMSAHKTLAASGVFFAMVNYPKTFHFSRHLQKGTPHKFYAVVLFTDMFYFSFVSLLVTLNLKLTKKLTEVTIKYTPYSSDKRAFDIRCLCEHLGILYCF